MRKYSAAPKDIADAIRDAVPVSAKEALGEDWKKLPPGSGRPKARKRAAPALGRHIAVSKQKVFHNPVRKGKAGYFERVKIGGVCLEVPGTAGEAYTKDLIKVVKDYIKKHPVKA